MHTYSSTCPDVHCTLYPLVDLFFFDVATRLTPPDRLRELFLDSLLGSMFVGKAAGWMCKARRIFRSLTAVRLTNPVLGDCFHKRPRRGVQYAYLGTTLLSSTVAIMEMPLAPIT